MTQTSLVRSNKMFKHFFHNRKVGLTLGVESRTALIALVFLFAMCFFEVFYLRTGIPQSLDSLVHENYSVVYFVIWCMYLAATLYLTFLFILMIVASRWPLKLVGFVFFGAVVFTEYAYQRALGRFTDYYDVVAAISATGDQQVDSVYAYWNPLALLPCALLAICCLLVKERRNQFGGKKFAVLLLCTALFYLHFTYVNQFLFDRQFASCSLGSFSQTAADYFLLYNPVTAAAAPKREALDFRAPPGQAPANNIVLVFDESIRGDHLSLNGYTRKTTPYLDELARKKLLTNWGIAVSASTSSHPSYDAFVSGAPPELLEQGKFEQINTMPTIFQYAKAMNYHTYLFDGQMKNYWGGIKDDLNYIDNFVSLAEIDNPDRVEDYEHGGKISDRDDPHNKVKQWEIDTKIAKMVNEVLSGSTGNFVFVYKRGAHFPYEKNYPADQSVWEPVYFFTNQWEVPAASQRDAIINSYDNALHYNLDGFFQTLVGDYSDLPNGTVILYTGDHGESFFTDGKAGHGGSSREEAEVPLFALGLNRRSIDSRFKASHSNVFTTLLDLMAYPSNSRKYAYAISLLNAKETDSSPRSFNLASGKRLPFE